MACKLSWVAFNESGSVIGSQEIFLPNNLDWKSIEEKEVYMRFMGGLPAETTHCLISSQGQRKLFYGDMKSATAHFDKATFDRKMENVEEHLENQCRVLGIDRTAKPRNQ